MAYSKHGLVAAHFAGWMVIGLARAASLRLIVSPEVWPRLAALKVGNAMLSMIASTLFIFIYRWCFARSERLPLMVLIVAPLGAALAIFFADAVVLRTLIDGGAPKFEWARIPLSMVSNSLLLYGWTGLYLAVRFAQQANEKAQEALRADALAHHAQLLALHYQLNPHFLFNALNASRSLISTAPDRARSVIGCLAAFLRYALDTSPNQMVTLAQEVEAIQYYAAIDKARFEERVKFDIDVDPTVLKERVPPLFMMPLVENASKHGVPGQDGVAIISIEVGAYRQGFRIVVRNIGRLAQKRSTSPGIGLPNVDARMTHAFADRYRRSLRQEEDIVVCEILVARGGKNA
ncbi:MAG: histidine kinase [Myxococcota bacterium]